MIMIYSQVVDEERTEDFYLPDRRYETSKNGETKSGKYQIEKFTKDEAGDYVCPAGLKMKYIQTKEYEDWHGNCEECIPYQKNKGKLPYCERKGFMKKLGKGKRNLYEKTRIDRTCSWR